MVNLLRRQKKFESGTGTSYLATRSVVFHEFQEFGNKIDRDELSFSVCVSECECMKALMAETKQSLTEFDMSLSGSLTISDAMTVHDGDRRQYGPKSSEKPAFPVEEPAGQAQAVH
jgi:hypothetical protein